MPPSLQPQALERLPILLVPWFARTALIRGGAAVGGGRQRQRQLSRLVAIEEPRCSQEKGNCGPTAPPVDYGADVDLTEGWLNLEYECCPCLGRGVQRIGYDQFNMAGSYNPYTMNLCTQCEGCS